MTRKCKARENIITWCGKEELWREKALSLPSFPPVWFWYQPLLAANSLGAWNRLKRNWRQWLCRSLGVNKVLYGLGENGEYNKNISKNLYYNRVWFPKDRNIFVLDHQHGYHRKMDLLHNILSAVASFPRLLNHSIPRCKEITCSDIAWKSTNDSYVFCAVEKKTIS